MAPYIEAPLRTLIFAQNSFPGYKFPELSYFIYFQNVFMKHLHLFCYESLKNLLQWQPL